MSEPTNATIFTQRFIDLLDDYKDHSGKYDLQIERKDWGQVSLTLVDHMLALANRSLPHRDRKPIPIIRELVTPTAFNPLGNMGYFMRSIKRKTSSQHVLTSLFFKIVGLPYDIRLETDPYAEISTLYSILTHPSVPPEHRKWAEKRLEQTILVYQIVALLTKVSTEDRHSSYQHLVEIQSQQCTVYRNEQQIPLSEGPFTTWLWAYFKKEGDSIPIPEGQELIKTIAETDDNRCSLIRALSQAMSHEAARPIEHYLEWIAPAHPPQQWTHQYRYTICFNNALSVTQKGESSLSTPDKDAPPNIVRWSISIQFGQKFCIDDVKYTIDSIQGFDSKINSRIMFHNLEQWERPFLGNIEALFHHPDIRTFMTWKMGQQSEFFTQIESGSEIIYGQQGCGFVNPRLLFLLRSLNVPLHRCIEAFNTEAFEAYIRKAPSPSNLLGVLIAVSHLPFEEVTKYIDKSQPQSTQMDHKCSKIDIFHHALEVVVVHHGISTRLGKREETLGSITWSLKIALSPRGYPSDISFESKENGDVRPLRGFSIPQFIPPSYHTQPKISTTRQHTVVPFIHTPSQGLTLNGQLLDIQPGIDPLTLLFEKLDPVLQHDPALETHVQMQKWLLSCHSPKAQLLRALTVAFSQLPLIPIVECLQRIRPTAIDETWEHENVSGEVSENERTKTVIVKRTITSRCVYRYVDLFQQPQSRPQVTVTWELSSQYTLQGKPIESSAKYVSGDGLDGFLDASPTLFFSRSTTIGRWSCLPSQAVDTVFQNPPPLNNTIEELARMNAQVSVNSQQHSKIILVEDELEIVPDGRSGLEILLQKVGAPNELQIASRDQQAFSEALRAIVKRRRAWTTLMKELHMDETYSCTEENIEIFRSFLVDFLDERDQLSQQFAARSQTCPALPSVQEMFDSSSLQSKIPSTSKHMSLSAKEIRKEDLIRINEILLTLGIDLQQPASSVPLEFFLEKWRQNDRDTQITNFPFLVGIAGGQEVLSCMTNTIEKQISFDFVEANKQWQHRDVSLTIHTKADGGSEIRIEKKSMLAELKEGRGEREEQKQIASITWTLAMRFNATGALVRTISAVKEICSPPLQPQDIQRICSLLNSTWDSSFEPETVCPLVSMSNAAYQLRYPSSPHHSVRLPALITGLATQPHILSFMHQATEFSLNITKLLSILSKAEQLLVKKYAQGAKSPLSGFSLLESLLFIGRGKESRLCHSISTVLYHSEATKDTSVISNIEIIPWKIELILDSEGKTKEVCIGGIQDDEVSHVLTQECKAFLPYVLEPVQYEVSISRTPQGRKEGSSSTSSKMVIDP